MKKIVITIVGLFFIHVAQGQIQKSTWMLAGGFGWESAKESGSSDATNTLAFTPRIGYFLVNGILLGVYSDLANISSGDTKIKASLSGPLARYYHQSGLFGELTYGFGKDRVEVQSFYTEGKKSGWSVGAGFAAFLGTRVAIETLLRYRSLGATYETTIFVTPPADTTTGIFDVVLGITAYLGKASE